MCMSISARRSCGAQRSHGDGSSVRLVDRASTLSSYGMGATYQGSNSPEPAADTRILGRLALSEGAESSRRARRGRLCSRLVGPGTGTFERWEAGPAPCGARTVAQSTWWDAQPTTFSKNRCPAHSLGRAEVIRASTDRTLYTRLVGRYVGL